MILPTYTQNAFLYSAISTQALVKQNSLFAADEQCHLSGQIYYSFCWLFESSIGSNSDIQPYINREDEITNLGETNNISLMTFNDIINSLLFERVRLLKILQAFMAVVLYSKRFQVKLSDLKQNTTLNSNVCRCLLCYVPPVQYSLCNEPLIELTNPGASGSIFYVTCDDEFIIKTVQHKEAEFLQKLLPGYYMVSETQPLTQ